MENNWNSIGVFVSVCGSVVVSLCFAIQKSKCDKVKICFGLVDCHRKVNNIDPNKDLTDPNDLENNTINP